MVVKRPLIIGTNIQHHSPLKQIVSAHYQLVVAVPLLLMHQVSGTALMVTSNAGSPAIVATGNSTPTAPALQLINNPPSAVY